MSPKDFPKLLRTGYPSTGCAQPWMHFTAQTGLERVFDAVKRNEVLIDQREGKIQSYTNFEKNSPKNWQTDASSQPNSLNTTARYKVNVLEASRNLRGILHNKTHFQAAMALVNRQSRSLLPPPNKKQATGTEPDELLKGYDPIRQEIEDAGSLNLLPSERRRSLPKIKVLTVDNTSPLKEIKKKNSAYLAGLIAGEFGKGESPRALDSFGNKKDLDSSYTGQKKLKLPAIASSNDLLQNDEEKNDTEEMAKKMLRHCHVIRGKSPVAGGSGILRKGEGKLMSGFGMTNREAYNKVFGKTYN